MPSAAGQFRREMGFRRSGPRNQTRNRTAAEIASATSLIPTPPRADWWRAPAAPVRTRFRLLPHPRQVCAHMRSEVDLVDDEKVAAQQARALLTRDIIAPRGVDHKYPVVDELDVKVKAKLSPPDSKRIKWSPEIVASSSLPGRCSGSGPRGSPCAGSPPFPPRIRAARIDQPGAPHALGILVRHEVIRDHRSSMPRGRSPGAAPRSARSCPTRRARRCQPGCAAFRPLRPFSCVLKRPGSSIVHFRISRRANGTRDRLAGPSTPSTNTRRSRDQPPPSGRLRCRTCHAYSLRVPPTGSIP